MSYDCSVTKRKGCNYCLRGKLIEDYHFDIQINDHSMKISYDDSEVSSHSATEFAINYCLVCGRELNSKDKKGAKNGKQYSSNTNI